MPNRGACARKRRDRQFQGVVSWHDPMELRMG